VLTGLGRSERRVAAARYIHGLLLPGQRKSIEPMAQRLGVDAQSLTAIRQRQPVERPSVVDGGAERNHTNYIVILPEFG